MLNVSIKTPDVKKLTPSIRVIGVGGGGGNAVNNMMASGVEGCDFLVCNADAQALNNSPCTDKVQLGVTVTGGLGAGSKPEVGQAAAEESIQEITQYLEGANMAFITAGMGGGTGTGAAPVIAKACRELGILTVGVVTKPFHFEGSHRMRSAEEGIEEMQKYVDTLIVIPNQNLFRIASEKTTFAEAFKMADGVLQSGVRGVTDLMVRPGLVNLDFADIRTAMIEQGKAMMGTGEAEGEKRAIEAAEAAINNPLLDDVTMKGANGVIINVTGGYDMTLFEADEACNRIRDEVDPNANIIFGATFDESMDGKMRVSIVATGIEKSGQGTGTTTGTGIGGVTMAAPLTATTSVAQTSGTPSPFAPSAAPVSIQTTQTQPQQSVQSAPLSTRSNTQSYAAMTATVAADTVSVPTPAQLIEQNLDMFEQGEFASSDGAVQEVSSALPTNTALRGTRYKNSFIPPKPAIPAKVAPPIVAGGYTPDQVAAVRPEQTVASTGLKLNPPKMPTPSPRKQTPSLLERITGTVQQKLDDIREEYSSSKTEPVTPQLSDAPAQAGASTDAPSKPATTQTELDIPAFLRRQAN